jgi:N-acetylmuramoyl-L-alanine amidase
LLQEFAKLSKKYLGKMPDWNKSIIPLIKRLRIRFLALGVLFFIPSMISDGSDGSYYRLRKVVIDAGHGGYDPGALGRHYREKDLVLGIALKLGECIRENYPDIEVIYTRKDDTFVPLHERADIANKNKADLFISIHANSAKNKDISGTETYVMGLHTDEKNFEVAKKENSVIVLEKDYNSHYEGFDPNSAESYIIFTLMQNAYLDQSMNLAALIQEEIREQGKRSDRGVKQAGFIVLWRTSMPSVLIETGYITNGKDEKYLNSKDGQSYLASSIFRAFRDYKKSVESRSQFKSNTAINDTFTDKVKESEEEKIFFKVQITAARNQIALDSEFFGKLKHNFPDMKIEELSIDGIYKYVAGSDTSYQGILIFSQKVKQLYPGSFIVAIRGDKLIPLKEALNSNK